MFFKAPAIPTYDGEANQQSDPNTIQLRDELNSVREIPYTQPSYTHDYFLRGGLDDSQYNPGYKQVPVDNQVSLLPTHYEAPEVPVTQLPFKQNLYNTTLAQETIAGTPVFSLRAPGINEGF